MTARVLAALLARLVALEAELKAIDERIAEFNR
jgi:hypothetical protein